MNTIVNKISIDVMKPAQTPVIHAVQGERESRIVEMTLLADGNPWEIPAGAFLTVRYGRSTLSGGYYDTLPDGTPACGYDGNIVTMVLAPQMVAEAGAVLTQVEILHDQQMLATFAFRLMVEVNPAVGIVQPENYVNWLRWMQDQLELSVEHMIENGGFTGPAGPTGPAGTNGASATLLSTVVDYQAADSGTVIPTGSWSSSVPVVEQGKYLWTRTTNTFNTGSPAVSYCVSRMGLDGTGSVSSVANISPDDNGNVPLSAEHVGALACTGGALSGELKMNGQVISGLNFPVADNQAANKGYVDSAKTEAKDYAKEYSNAAVRKAALRNLLDNSDFRNPVNQRGQTSYTGAVYGIDRWTGANSATTVSVEDGYIRITKNLSSTNAQATQLLKQYIVINASNRGKTVTLAAKIKGGSVRLNFNNSAFATYTNSSEWSIQVIKATIPVNAFTFFIGIEGENGSDFCCEWAALYEGEYIIDMLPEYRSKGYGAELAECQRYYQIVKDGFGNIRSNGTTAYLSLPLCTPMRSTDVSLTYMYVPAVRANGTAYPAADATGEVAEYIANSTAVKVNLTGSFSGAANQVAYADGIFHLCADIL